MNRIDFSLAVVRLFVWLFGFGYYMNKTSEETELWTGLLYFLICLVFVFLIGFELFEVIKFLKG